MSAVFGGSFTRQPVTNPTAARMNAALEDALRNVMPL
jgi:hypothetical protein